MAEIAGLTLITPSSVAGSGVSLSGAKVVFTAATSVSVNDVFDGTYDNYLSVIQFTTSGGINIRCRLRASGTDNSTASSYVSQFLGATSTTVYAGRNTNDRFQYFMSGYNTQRNGAHAYFYGPALAQPTALRTVTALDLSSAYIEDGAGTHNQSTAYDGFSLLTLSATTMTGSLTVYGLSQ